MYLFLSIRHLAIWLGVSQSVCLLGLEKQNERIWFWSSSRILLLCDVDIQIAVVGLHMYKWQGSSHSITVEMPSVHRKGSVTLQSG
jgi:hypothetical protein